MTLRDAIDGLLANPEPGTDPSATLAEAGFDDVSSDLFGTALSHYADAAPLAAADALAPIVTRVGPVPFEESDLPDADVEPGLDAFALFAEVGPDPAASIDVDPVSDIDPDADPLDLDLGSAGEVRGVPSVDDGSSFGVGDTEADLDSLEAPAEELAEEAVAFSPDEEFDDGFDQLEAGDELLDEGTDLFSVEFDDAADDGADPLDLDFDA